MPGLPDEEITSRYHVLAARVTELEKLNVLPATFFWINRFAAIARLAIAVPPGEVPSA